MAFTSQSYEWLVVNQGGTNAQFKGSGLINGAADPNGNAYKFMLWAADSSTDTFHIASGGKTRLESMTYTTTASTRRSALAIS